MGKWASFRPRPAARMAVEERRAKFTFLRGTSSAQPPCGQGGGAAESLGVAAEPSGGREEVALSPQGSGAPTRGDGGPSCPAPPRTSWRPGRRATPQKVAEADPRRGRVIPSAGRRPRPPPRGVGGNAASRFLVFCQKHRDEVGVGMALGPGFVWGAHCPRANRLAVVRPCTRGSQGRVSSGGSQCKPWGQRSLPLCSRIFLLTMVGRSSGRWAALCARSLALP